MNPVPDAKHDFEFLLRPRSKTRSTLDETPLKLDSDWQRGDAISLMQLHRMSNCSLLGSFLLACSLPLQAELNNVAIDQLPAASAPSTPAKDWLIDSSNSKTTLSKGAEGKSIVLANGLLRCEWRVEPAVAIVSLRDETTGHDFLRATGPEANVTLNGTAFPVGGLVGQRSSNFLSAAEIPQLKPLGDKFALKSISAGPCTQRFPWKRQEKWISQSVEWPPKGQEIVFTYSSAEPGVEVQVHYEMTDGLPCLSKWMSVKNNSSSPVLLDSFKLAELHITEADADVEDPWRFQVPPLHVETDFTTGSMSNSAAQNQTVTWTEDKQHHTQTNYGNKSLCLLNVAPPSGPARELKTGESLTTFRLWIMPLTEGDADRRTLSLGKFYRTTAPWVLENPLMFHLVKSDIASCRSAIDQMAETGFEMLILSFGSGFNLESTEPAYFAKYKSEVSDYASSKGIVVGTYSLLSSRRISDAHDVINPKTGKPGGIAKFGNAPCLCSQWGLDHLALLQKNLMAAGFLVHEHDGSYPGDVCGSTSHPGHKGLADSRWNQREQITKYYQWCRAQGIYLNVPDWYVLQGSNRNSMGYREDNWSLPRAMQEIIERQNILDGTRYKLPSMGWMHLPLTQYHGGGAAAVYEPLTEHRSDYSLRLASLLGGGVTGVVRGTRLYDSPETMEEVKRRVSFYKKHRAILDSEILPLRRADGRDWDGWIHVNPSLPTPALAMLFNALETPLQRRISIPLRYAGLNGNVMVKIGDGQPQQVQLNQTGEAVLDINLPSRSATPLLVRTGSVWDLGTEGINRLKPQ